MSWITPLGLPVVQPYRRIQKHTVVTVLQSITLNVDNDSLPVSSSKQRSAFPPNFVHSLDASHMLLTCLKMKEYGLDFAAVHDSYWTHPCDLEILNQVRRSIRIM
jgi:DNA-directed RNA polymerase